MKSTAVFVLALFLTCAFSLRSKSQYTLTAEDTLNELKNSDWGYVAHELLQL